MSISSLFNIGTSALNAQQVNIAVTGNNIANVDTEGYCVQYVQLTDAYSLTDSPGAVGMGVDAVEILRYFDSFLEQTYLSELTVASRWEEEYSNLTTIENIFNESNSSGISGSLTDFFLAWQDLALYPDSSAARQNIISSAESLLLLLDSAQDSLDAVASQMDIAIQSETEKVNELTTLIADLNGQITANTIAGVSNPNDLLNQRDLAVRELAELVDITTETDSAGNYNIYLTSGHTLVQGQETFSLEVLGPRAESNKISGSTYEGSVVFSGTDSYEYTVEMLTGGSVGDDPAPTFRVSLDGGQTWISDENGQEIHYEVTDIDGDGAVDPVQVHNLEISFDDTENFTEGDRFIITPKDGIYWISSTRGAENITPQTYADGTENTNRLTGGTITSYFAVRDEYVGTYSDELDAIADAIAWEVNSLHSQGANSVNMTSVLGTESVNSEAIALGLPQSGLYYYDQLTTGSVQFSLYNSSTGDYLNSASLDFSSITPGTTNFDPSIHSLEDVAEAINLAFPGQLVATIESGSLNIEADPTADPPVEFAVGTDTTGLMAALGINTFFKGSSEDGISINSTVYQNLDLINSGSLNGGNTLGSADGSIANSIGALLTTDVSISTAWGTTTTLSISEYYSTLVSKVGADTSTASTNADYHSALAANLAYQQESVTGVNLDEELANLIKFQSAYTAAAKLITTADEMLQTLLSLKQ